MVRERFRTEVIVFLLLVFVFINLVSVSGDNNSGKIDAGVYQNLSGNEEISVNVRFKDNKDSGLLNLFSESLEETKVGIIAEIGEEKLKYEDDNEIYINVTLDEVKILEKKRNVERVEVEGVRGLFLQDSKRIVNATRAWSLMVSEENITGKGESVCVIDSGIDYRHVEFGSCTNETFLAGNCSSVVGGYDFVNNDENPMDDNGHGTHVSGIVKGIAPGANIVSIKACSSGGSCEDSAISAGINWCIGNATKYNISVISMSLGGGLYSSYCNSDPLADEIEDAVSNNISVVIASGNSGNVNKISAPSCVSGAIAVSATNKDDSIASYSDRNQLVNLVAPGTGINSTIIGDYGLKTGTSMATPHVAGAIAILNQFLSLNGNVGEEKTPGELEDILRDTGRFVEDIGVGAVSNYSRIDIYSALISLDSLKPEISLISPENNSLSSQLKQEFSCNATDLSLENVNFYLWDSNNSVINLSSQDIGGNYFDYEINISNLTLGDEYHWNCLFSDEKGNKDFAESNYSLRIDGLSLILETPEDGSYLNSEEEFVCSSESEEMYSLKNVTFNLWNSTDLVYFESKDISGKSESTGFNYVPNTDGEYEWNCVVMNNNSDSLFALTNRSFIFDSVKPDVVLQSPDDGNSSFTGSQEINYLFNVSDFYGVNNCNLIIDSVSVVGNISAINLTGENTLSYITDAGTHNWSVNCTDLAGNVGNSSLRGLIVNAVPVVESSSDSSSSSSSSGGGGGSSITVATIKAETNNTEDLGDSDSSSGNLITGNAVNLEEGDSAEDINRKGFGITGLVIDVKDVVSNYGFFILVLVTLTVLFLVVRMYLKKKKNDELSEE